MNAGVYEHRGHYYLFVGLCRMHKGVPGQEYVAYIPLRIDPAWSHTARIALRHRHDFELEFEWVGDRLPEVPAPNIEQVARATFEAYLAECGVSLPWDRMGPEHHRAWMMAAQAAIGASHG